jgi:hypothetical protein
MTRKQVETYVYGVVRVIHALLPLRQRPAAPARGQCEQRPRPNTRSGEPASPSHFYLGVAMPLPRWPKPSLSSPLGVLLPAGPAEAIHDIRVQLRFAKP